MEVIHNNKHLENKEILKTLGKLGSNHTSLELLQKGLSNEKKLSEHRTLSDGLKTILVELFENTKSNKTLLDMMKNSTIFKTVEQFGSETKNLIKLIEQKNQQNGNITYLKSLFVGFDSLDEKTIKQAIEKNILSSQTKDILSLLSQYEDKEIQNQANKIIGQIDYFQMVSYLGNSIYSYLPFDWNSFDGGDIEFKKEQDKQYSCYINLQLKEYGSVKINLLFDEQKHFSIGFFLESGELKEMMSNNLQNLRIKLREIDATVQNISLIDLQNIQNDNRLNAFLESNIEKIDLDLRV